MSYRTLKESTIDVYWDWVKNAPTKVLEDLKRERNERLVQFPYAVMLELSYPEMDVANRWCWQNFGPAHGECHEKYSDYRVCQVEETHRHTGIWTMHWFTKTDYDYGLAEWYFSNESDYERFRQNIPNIDWGEKYPVKYPVI